jgi:hypothetical protein
MARRIVTGMARARRSAAGLSKVSMTLPAELAWRLRVKATMAGIGLGDLCVDALKPLVTDDHLPWDRYRPRPPGEPSDGRQEASQEVQADPAIEAGQFNGDPAVSPPAPAPGEGEGGKRPRRTIQEQAARFGRRKAG